jgi:hypothetical protein
MLESEIKHMQHSQVWPTKLASPRANYSAWILAIQPRLQEWCDTVPQPTKAHPSSIFAQAAYWDYIYHNAILLLYRPNNPNPNTYSRRTHRMDKSPDLPRGISRCVWHELDHYHHVSEAELSVARAMDTNAVAYSDTSTDEQKKDWFLRLNPNGRQSPSLSLHRELTMIRSHSCNHGQYPVACVSRYGDFCTTPLPLQYV